MEVKGLKENVDQMGQLGQLVLLDQLVLQVRLENEDKLVMVEILVTQEP